MASLETIQPRPGARKTILVLDDEADVRKLIANTLATGGYHVLSADSGERAIKAFKTSKQPVDLLLLDVVSPGMSGPMVADRLTALKPGLPVLFISGYGDTSVVQRYVVEKGYSLLTKPFNGEQLVKSVREALASAKH